MKRLKNSKKTMNKQEKHIPFRMCVGCRQMFPKENLMRMVKDKETGEIGLDKEHNIQTRGVYLCKNKDCVLSAKKKKSLERNFKSAVSDETYERAAKDWITY